MRGKVKIAAVQMEPRLMGNRENLDKILGQGICPVLLSSKIATQRRATLLCNVCVAGEYQPI